MAAQDLEVLQHANALIESAYLQKRHLDRWVKELIFITSPVVARARESHPGRTRVTLDLEASAAVPEVIEIALLEVGVAAFQSAEAWQEPVQADCVELTVSAHDA